MTSPENFSSPPFETDLGFSFSRAARRRHPMVKQHTGATGSSLKRLNDRTLLAPLATQQKQDVVPAPPFHPMSGHVGTTFAVVAMIGRDAKPVLPPDGRVTTCTGTLRLMGHDGPSQGHGFAVNAANMLWTAILG